MLDHTPERVAVGGDQHLLALLDLGHNHLVPIRKGPFNIQRFQVFKNSIKEQFLMLVQGIYRAMVNLSDSNIGNSSGLGSF